MALAAETTAARLRPSNVRIERQRYPAASNLRASCFMSRASKKLTLLNFITGSLLQVFSPPPPPPNRKESSKVYKVASQRVDLRWATTEAAFPPVVLDAKVAAVPGF